MRRVILAHASRLTHTTQQQKWPLSSPPTSPSPPPPRWPRARSPPAAPRFPVRAGARPIADETNTFIARRERDEEERRRSRREPRSMSRAPRATRDRGLTVAPPTPFDNSQALRVGEGCAQAAGGCQVRAADRKPVPVRFQARDRARGRALRARESGNARARPRSARATSRPRACRLRGIRSRARGRGRGDIDAHATEVSPDRSFSG